MSLGAANEQWLEENVKFRNPFQKRQSTILSISSHMLRQKSAPTLVGFDGIKDRFLPHPVLDHEVALTDNGKWSQKKLGYPWYILRSCAFVNYIREIDAKADFALDFSDAAYHHWYYETNYSVASPVWQYTRLKWDKKAILAPLVHFMEIGGSNLPDRLLNDVDWTNKLSKIVWRGVFSGNYITESTKGPTVLTSNSEKWRLAISGVGKEEILTTFDKFVRWKIVERSNGSKILDANFVGYDTFDANLKKYQIIDDCLHSRYGSSLSIPEQLKYKYIICPEGNDVSSSLYWVLASNSLAIVPDGNWENMFFCNLTPWVHYVPVNASLDNLESIFEWCESNENQVRQIISNANRHIEKYMHQRERDLLDFLTVESYCQSFSQAGRFENISFGSDVNRRKW